MDRSGAITWQQFEESAFLDWTCNERFSGDSKTAQDQSWRREAVRGAPTFSALSRRYRFDSSSPITRRYQKELALYRAEVVENQRKLQSFTATASTNGEGGGGESWDVRNAVRENSSTPRIPCSVYNSCFPSPFLWQASLVRESETMVRDTTTRLERAAGELEDLIVRATLSPPFL